MYMFVYNERCKYVFDIVNKSEHIAKIAPSILVDLLNKKSLKPTHVSHIFAEESLSEKAERMLLGDEDSTDAVIQKLLQQQEEQTELLKGQQAMLQQLMQLQKQQQNM